MTLTTEWLKERLKNPRSGTEFELINEVLANREAQPVASFPEAKDKSQCWKIDPEYLHAIADAVGSSDDEGTPSMELVEAVLLAAVPPAPAVHAAPDFEAWFVEKYKQTERLVKNEDGTYKFSGVQMAFSAWNACRAAMLNHVGDANEKVAEKCECSSIDYCENCLHAMLAQPVSQGYTLNSPEIPDGWKMVPVDLNDTMKAVLTKLSQRCGCEHCVKRSWRELLAAAPQPE